MAWVAFDYVAIAFCAMVLPLTIYSARKYSSFVIYRVAFASVVLSMLSQVAFLIIVNSKKFPLQGEATIEYLILSSISSLGIGITFTSYLFIIMNRYQRVFMLSKGTRAYRIWMTVLIFMTINTCSISLFASLDDFHRFFTLRQFDIANYNSINELTENDLKNINQITTIRATTIAVAGILIILLEIFTILKYLNSVLVKSPSHSFVSHGSNSHSSSCQYDRSAVSIAARLHSIYRTIGIKFYIYAILIICSDLFTLVIFLLGQRELVPHHSAILLAGCGTAWHQSMCFRLLDLLVEAIQARKTTAKKKMSKELKKLVQPNSTVGTVEATRMDAV